MNIIILSIILIFVPFLVGIVCGSIIHTNDFRFFSIILYGYLLMFSLFWLTAVPIILISSYMFQAVVWIYGSELLILSIVGCILTIHNNLMRKKIKQEVFNIKGFIDENDKISLFCWFVFLVILAYQIYKSILHASFDGDDAYYVALSNIANQQNNMYGIIPYNGAATELQIQHAIAPLPIFIAFIARVSGIHSTIIAHLVIPIVLIPLTYYAYFLVGEKLFYKDRKGIPVFLIFISLLQIYGDLSIFTKEKFFLTRTWQGKSVYANLILTLLLFLVLSLSEYQKNKAEKKEFQEANDRYSIWPLLCLTNTAACLMTSMSAVISTVFLGVSGILISIRYRNINCLWKILLCCIPYFIELILCIVC